MNRQGLRVCPESGWRYHEVTPGMLRCLGWPEDAPLPAGHSTEGHPMAPMTRDIPQALAALPARERVLLLHAGWYAAWRAWMRQVEDDVADAETHVHH